MNITTSQDINNTELEAQVSIPNNPPIRNEWESFALKYGYDILGTISTDL